MTRTTRGRSPRRARWATASAVLVVAVGTVLAGGAAQGATPSTSSPATVAPAAALPPVQATATAEDLTETRLTRQLRRAIRAADGARQVPSRTTPVISEAGQDKPNIPVRCATDGVRSTDHDVCNFGAVDGDRTVALIGSSHMSMWLDGISGPAVQDGTRMLGYFKFGCTPLVVRSINAGRVWDECAEWREWALASIAGADPDVVVVGAHTYARLAGPRGGEIAPDTARFDRVYAAGLRKLVSRLEATGTTVMVLGDSAERPAEKRPQRCLRRERLSLAACEHQLSARDLQVLTRDRDATREAGGKFFDTNRLACRAGRCPVAAAGFYTYRDFAHVTNSWAKHVGGILADRALITR